MFFARAVLAFIAVGAVSVFATPAPVVQKRQDISDVLSVLNTLDASTKSILPQIDSLAASPDATEDDVAPYLQQLADALNLGATSLNSLGPVDATSGGTKDEVATKTADIYTNIATTLDNAKGKKPHWGPFFPKFGIDAALAKILFGLGIVVAGVLKLVAALLKVVSGLLAGLGFTLLLALLGL
jgi:hypothetical protein